MQVPHYEFVMVKEINKLVNEFDKIEKEDLIHLRDTLIELIKQNDRMAMLYHISTEDMLKEVGQ